MGMSRVQEWNAPGAASRSGALDQRFSLDVQGVDALRRTVRSSPEEGVKQVSRQFEALFMNMVLKSMREATPTTGLLESQSGKVYLSLLDQQLAQNLSGRGLGLAEAMFAQLRRSMGPAASAANLADSPGPEVPVGGALPSSAGPESPAPFDLRQISKPIPTPLPAAAAAEGAAAALPFARAHAAAAAQALPSGASPEAALPASGAGATLQSRVDGFVARMGPSAQAASAASGVPAALILAQAALESGWGRREIRADDGSPSFNLFGIKADRGWRGAVVETTTTEYVDGVPQRVRARFRAYASYQEGFADYARFLAGNPRYADVVSATDPAEAAHGLQRAGYATDPQYGSKLVRIMQKLV